MVLMQSSERFTDRNHNLIKEESYIAKVNLFLYGSTFLEVLHQRDMFWEMRKIKGEGRGRDG